MVRVQDQSQGRGLPVLMALATWLVLGRFSGFASQEVSFFFSLLLRMERMDGRRGVRNISME